MPTFDITAPDGTKYEVTGPEGSTEQQALAQVQAQHQAAPPNPLDSTINQRLATSLPVRVGRGMMDPVMGGIQAIAHLVGSPATKFIDDRLKVGEQMYQGDRRATGQDGLDFGRIAGNIASPVNFAAPEISVLGKLGTAGKIINGAVNGGLLGGLQPVLDGGDYGSEKGTQVAFGAGGGAALPVLGAAAKLAGKVAPAVLGQTTGVGSSSVRNAFEAGVAGGEKGAAFKGAMRDPSTWDQVVQDAKGAVASLKADRSKAYTSGMVDISKDATILDFKPIDEALEKASGIKNFKGKDLSPKTADARKEVTEAIDDWRASDPAEYHTPEGFDALKQKLGGIKDSYQYGTPQWKIANDAYSAVRGTIADQAPAYNKVMGDYSKASDGIAELEKELSLGRKGNPNTALRKLQSVMRDNANTSWGKRSQLAGGLSDAGATNLMPALAGQALSTPIPRGLTKYADMAMLGPALMHNPALLPLTAAASPRAVGELAYGAGSAVRGAKNIRAKLPIGIPALPPGLLGSILPQLLANTPVNGAQ